MTDVPKLDESRPEEIQLGQQLFLEKGCSSCHLVKGISPQTDFGPDLSKLGSKTLSQLEFGTAKIPPTLTSYIQAKITDPVSVNPAARMPQYHLEPGHLEALTTALLSMTGGLIGIATGLLATWLIGRLAQWPTVLEPTSVAASFLFSGGVGIFFGYYPAWKASRLDPIEALRYE